MVRHLAYILCSFWDIGRRSRRSRQHPALRMPPPTITTPQPLDHLQGPAPMHENDPSDPFLSFQRMVDICPECHQILIAGYSYGCSIAFHIANLLAEENWRQPLILLDGSPAYVSARMDRLVQKYSRGLVRNQEDRLWLSMLHSYLKFLVKLDSNKVLLFIYLFIYLTKPPIRRPHKTAKHTI